MTDLIKHQPHEIFSSDEKIAGLVRRMRFMIPGAEKAPDATVWNAAQLATIHRLDPFSGDINCYEIAGKWLVNVGVSAWRRVAQRQAKYTHKFRALTPEEVKSLRGADYDPADVGVECTIWRLDTARECKELGIPYEPVIACGLWRTKAYRVQNEWKPDNIPNTETPQSVAQRRSEKKALKIAFILDFPTDDPPDNTSWRVAEVERQISAEERNRAPVVHPEPNREENGDLVFA